MKKLLSAVVTFAAVTLLFADPIEKTVGVPGKDADAKVGISFEGVKIESYTIQNYPDSAEIEKAKSTDPNDKGFVFFNFTVSNTSDKPMKVKIDVAIIGKDGKPVERSDRSDTVEPGKTDDNIRVMMHPKILNLVNAKEAKLRVTITPKS